MVPHLSKVFAIASTCDCKMTILLHWQHTVHVQCSWLTAGCFFSSVRASSASLCSACFRVTQLERARTTYTQVCTTASLFIVSIMSLPWREWLPSAACDVQSNVNVCSYQLATVLPLRQNVHWYVLEASTTKFPLPPCYTMRCVDMDEPCQQVDYLFQDGGTEYSPYIYLTRVLLRVVGASHVTHDRTWYHKYTRSTLFSRNKIFYIVISYRNFGHEISGNLLTFCICYLWWRDKQMSEIPVIYDVYQLVLRIPGILENQIDFPGAGPGGPVPPPPPAHPRFW